MAGSGLFSTLFRTLGAVAQAFGDLLLVAFIAIFLTANPGSYQNGVAMLFPKSRHDRVHYVLAELGRTVQGWLLVQLLSMFAMGVMIWLGLTLIGVQLALVLAIIAFLLEFIPFIRPWLAFAPAALIALASGSASNLLWVAGLYFVANMIEGNVLLPVLEKRAVDVPPALTLGAIFLLGALFGFVGILVAAPLVAVVFVFVKLVYVEGTLHLETTTPLEH
jgi:predicted PurR-regulated permease PerM